MFITYRFIYISRLHKSFSSQTQILDITPSINASSLVIRMSPCPTAETKEVSTTGAAFIHADVYKLCFKNLVYPPDNKDKSSSRIGVHGLNSGSQSAFGHWPGCTMVSGVGVVKLVGRLKLVDTLW